MVALVFATPVDCGEVMTVARTTRTTATHGAGREPVDVERPAADPVRPRPRGRPARRRRDRPLRAAVPGARAPRPRSGSSAYHRAAVPAHRPARVRRSWSPTSGGRGSTSRAPAPASSTPRCSGSPSASRCSASASAIITWAKKLLPDEVSIQDRHDGPSPRRRAEAHRRDHASTWSTRLGIKRRPLLKAPRCCRPAAARRGRRGAAGRRR